MALNNILSLIAFSSLAAFLVSLGPIPVTAVSVESSHFARSFHHHAIIKRKRSLSRRCKPRPSTSPKPKPSQAPEDAPKPPPSKPAKSNPPPKSSGNNNSGGSNKSDSKGNSEDQGTSVSVSVGGDGKVGLAWPNGDDPSLAKFVTKNVHFIYSWSPFKPSRSDSLGLRFMPMLWGDKQIGDFKKLVKKGYADIALGMNEPNQSGQSDMSPEHGVDLWLQYLNPLKDQGYYLISPATTSAPSGKKWMQDFFRICNGRCHVDAVALHYYDVSAQGFIDYVTDFHNTFQKPIFVTEFACQNFNGGAQRSQQEVDKFLTTTTQWMDKTSWVLGYFYFGIMHDMQNVSPANQLMAASGGPTELGFKYIN